MLLWKYWSSYSMFKKILLLFTNDKWSLRLRKNWNPTLRCTVIFHSLFFMDLTIAGKWNSYCNEFILPQKLVRYNFPWTEMNSFYLHVTSCVLRKICNNLIWNRKCHDDCRENFGVIAAQNCIPTYIDATYINWQTFHRVGNDLAKR